MVLLLVQVYSGLAKSSSFQFSIHTNLDAAEKCLAPLEADDKLDILSDVDSLSKDFRPNPTR